MTDQDATPLSSLHPTLLSQVLQSLGWAVERAPSTRSYQLWVNHSLRDEQLLVPTDPQKADYADLLSGVRRALIEDHGRAFEEALNLTLLQVRAHLDATRWQKESTLDSGMISWDIGEELYSAARSGLAAAAKATRESRRYFGNSSAWIAKRFLAETLMGQTEIGSFVVTAYTPQNQRFFHSKSSEESANSKMVNPESRSGAEIIDKLDQIVTAVRGKLDEYKRTPNTEGFDEIVEIGFSYEMANALSALARGGDGGIKITRTRSSDSVSEKEIAFDAVEAPVLEKVATRFAATREPELANLVGEVTLLDHVSTIGDRTIRLHVSNHPGVRTVRVRLSPEQYDDAIEAHRAEKRLRVTGTVEREGRYNWVYNPTAVSKVEDDPDDNDVATETGNQKQLSLLDDPEEP
jgi:hypothetical protein